MDLMKSLEFAPLEEQKTEVISDLDNALNLINIGRKLNGLTEFESLIKDSEDQIMKSTAIPNHVLNKTAISSLKEHRNFKKGEVGEVKEYTSFEEFKQEIAVATEAIEKEKASKVIHSNKAINDYNKKVNRIKKRDSKPTEADLQRIEQAQKERQAKREKNLVKAGN